MESADQFRVPPPPALDSPEYAAAFDEVKQLGGDGIVTPTVRTEEQTDIGIYWAYDGTPSLCAPPRLYNQIAVQIADQMGSNVIGACALAGAGQYGHGRCRPSLSGNRNITTTFGARSPVFESRTRGQDQPAKATAIQRLSAIRPSVRSVLRPAT